MDNAERKIMYLKKHQKGRCYISGMPLMYRGFGGVDMHHLLHNTYTNSRACPLFIDSILNLRLVNHPDHMLNPSAGIITLHRARIIESFLERHPKIAKFVNMDIEYGDDNDYPIIFG